jgi:hypothetical protein
VATADISSKECTHLVERRAAEREAAQKALPALIVSIREHRVLRLRKTPCDYCAGPTGMGSGRHFLIHVILCKL